MEVDKAVDVLKNDRFTRLWKHETHEGSFEGISFSRNPNFHYGNKALRLVLNLQKVKQKYKIVQLDAERAFHHSVENPRWYVIKDRKLNKNGQQYAEEFVLGDLKDLHKYIERIEIMKTASHSRKFSDLQDAVNEYAKKWKIQAYDFSNKGH
jgi:hypothetical protein